MTESLNTTFDLPDRIRAIAQEDPNRVALVHVKRSLFSTLR